MKYLRNISTLHSHSGKNTANKVEKNILLNYNLYNMLNQGIEINSDAILQRF